jgi:peptidoglycan biosynthesis protein MviN/MurJ (putative lipid II flippase)
MAVAVTLSTGFNALEDTKTQSFLGAGSSLTAKIVLNPILIAAFGAAGIALASSLMYVVSGALLGFVLRRRLEGMGGKHLLKTFFRVSIASLLAVSPVYLMVNHLHVPPVVVLVLGTLVGSLLYLLFSALLHIPELLLVQGSLRRLMSFRLLATIQARAGRGRDPSEL